MRRPGPDYIQFFPTLRCDRSCGFCFNRSLPALPDMSLYDFSIMLGQLSLHGVAAIDIIGGEPTLHRSITTMVKEAMERGFRVNVSSNGRDPDVLAKLCSMGPNVTTGISINDRETLGRLSAFIDRHALVVKTVFSAQLDRSFVSSITGLKQKKFYLIYRDVMEQRELAEATAFPYYVNTIKQSYGPSVGMVYCSGFIPDEDYPELATVRCPAGTTKLGVMPDGSVYPCNLFFGNPKFRLGNVLSDPFKTIWGHPALDYFRAFNANSCPRFDCEFHTRCHGGCPAQSLLLSGDLSAPDPRCLLT